MSRIWYPRTTWRTAVWRVVPDHGGENYCLFFTYKDGRDPIGVLTGDGAISVHERYSSFGSSDPGRPMPEREALDTLKQLEAKYDARYERVDANRLSYDVLGSDYHDAKPFRDHPSLIAGAPSFNQAAKPRHVESDDRSWRTAAYRVEDWGIIGFPYAAFCEIRPHPDVEKDRAGAVEFVTWRIGRKSVYRQAVETTVQQAMSSIQTFEYAHRDCKTMSPPDDPSLTFPPEFAKAADYRLHPHLNPEDVTTGRKVAAFKAIQLKPKA